LRITRTSAKLARFGAESSRRSYSALERCEPTRPGSNHPEDLINSASKDVARDCSSVDYDRVKGTARRFDESRDEVVGHL